MLGRATRVNRFERSKGLDTALYKNYIYLYMTYEYVQKQISAMAVGKATGPDGISVNNVANSIDVHSNIINTHIQSLDKVRALPNRRGIRVGHAYS